MKVRNILFTLAVIICAMTSCRKEDPLVVSDFMGLGGDSVVRTSIDKWIYDSLTVPYNISVQYRWNQSEFAVDKTLIPPDESKVIPLMNVLNNVWAKVYIAEAGQVFFNKYAPKIFVLCGSNEYRSNGSVTLGTAEGGRKVILYAVNQFRVKGMTGFNAATDSAFVKEWYLKTMHHEFAHILHQNIMYPLAFKQINPGLIQGTNWINWNATSCLQDGFITPYASSGFDDDFAEMVSVMLTEGKAGFDKKVNSITGTSANGTTAAKAQSYLRQKESIIVGYYKSAWGIDLYSLQARCRAAIDPLFK